MGPTHSPQCPGGHAAPRTAVLPGPWPAVLGPPEPQSSVPTLAVPMLEELVPGLQVKVGVLVALLLAVHAEGRKMLKTQMWTWTLTLGFVPGSDDMPRVSRRATESRIATAVAIAPDRAGGHGGTWTFYSWSCRSSRIAPPRSPRRTMEEWYSAVPASGAKKEGTGAVPLHGWTVPGRGALEMEIGTPSSLLGLGGGRATPLRPFLFLGHRGLRPVPDSRLSMGGAVAVQ